MKESPVLYYWEHKKGEDKYWALQKPLPHAKNQQVINDFMLSMKVVDYSEETIKQYRSFLYRFFKEQEEAFDTLAPEIIQTWFLNSKQLGFRVTPHVLRHTLAAHLAQRGIPDHGIQKLLGHDQLDTTQVYTRLFGKARKEKYDECM